MRRMPVVMHSAAVFGSSDSLNPEGQTRMRGARERFWKLIRLNRENMVASQEGVLVL